MMGVAMFPNELDIEANAEAKIERKRADIARKNRFMACTSPEEWAELVIQELQRQYQQGTYHPPGVFPCDRAQLEAWLATHNPAPAADDREAWAHYNPSLQYAVCRAIELHLDFEYVLGFDCDADADGFLVRVIMRIPHGLVSVA